MLLREKVDLMQLRLKDHRRRLMEKRGKKVKKNQLLGDGTQMMMMIQIGHHQRRQDLLPHLPFHSALTELTCQIFWPILQAWFHSKSLMLQPVDNQKDANTAERG